MSDAARPAYLQRPPLAPAQPEATLARRAHDGQPSWVLEGRPYVVQMAKRLFPGSTAMGRRACRFPATTRAFRELVWLQQRYAITVADPEAWEAQYRRTVDHVARLQGAAAAATRAGPGPAFTGTLYPFQERGVAWALNMRRTLIADEMGLGKTIQALAWLSRLGAWPAVVVAPAHMVRQWAGKIREFMRAADGGAPLFDSAGGDSVRLSVLRGLTPYDPGAADILLLHYGLVAAWAETLRDLRPGAVVFDEIQELRKPGTQKYTAASALADDVDCVLGLSGTPICGRGGEIWAVTNILERHALGDWDSFTREWCASFGSDHVVDPETLGAYLRGEGLLLRRLECEVSGQLPGVSRSVEYLDARESVFSAQLEAVSALLARADAAETAWERGRLEQQALEETRRATGLAKVEPAKVFLRALLSAGEPVVVFAFHHNVVDALADALAPWGVGCVTGRQTGAQKAEAQRRFEAAEANALILNLRATAGLDGLQHRARVCAFVELDWSPAVHGQAEKRLDRPPQDHAVLAYYLVVDLGTDPRMLDAIGLKAEQARGIQGDAASADPAGGTLGGEPARAQREAVLAELRRRTGQAQPTEQPTEAQ